MLVTIAMLSVWWLWSYFLVAYQLKLGIDEPDVNQVDCLHRWLEGRPYWWIVKRHQLQDHMWIASLSLNYDWAIQTSEFIELTSSRHELWATWHLQSHWYNLLWCVFNYSGRPEFYFYNTTQGNCVHLLHFLHVCEQRSQYATKIIILTISLLQYCPLKYSNIQSVNLSWVKLARFNTSYKQISTFGFVHYISVESTSLNPLHFGCYSFL